MTCGCMYFWIFLVVWGSRCGQICCWSYFLMVNLCEFEAAKSKNGTFHQFHRFFFPPFLERPGAPCPGLGPLISGTGHMESLRSTLYGIRGFGIEAARKVSVDDSFGDKKTTQKTLGIIIYDNSNNKHNNND